MLKTNALPMSLPQMVKRCYTKKLRVLILRFGIQTHDACPNNICQNLDLLFRKTIHKQKQIPTIVIVVGQRNKITLNGIQVFSLWLTSHDFSSVRSVGQLSPLRRWLWSLRCDFVGQPQRPLNTHFKKGTVVTWQLEQYVQNMAVGVSKPSEKQLQ